MDEGFRTRIEFIADEPSGLRFRLAFSGSSGRWLLPYPSVTGLRFVPAVSGGTDSKPTTDVVQLGFAFRPAK